MELLRVAGATINQIPGDWSGNTRRILKLLEDAKDQGIDIVCFPELAISGYNCEDMFLGVQAARRAAEALAEICQHSKNILAIVGLPVYHNGSLFNGAAVIQNERLLGINLKKVLPKEGVHYEPRWFDPWPAGEVVCTNLAGFNTISIGDLAYRFGEVRIGIEICEEAWSASGTDTRLGEAEIVLNPSASHFSLEKYQTREVLIANNSRCLQSHYVYSNLVGLESGRLIYDGGVIIASAGKIQRRGRRFEFGNGSLTSADVDLDQVRVAKLRNRAVRHHSNPIAPKVVEGEPFQIKPSRSENTPAFQSIHLSVPEGQWSLSVFEEFLAAQTLGLWDYLRKAHACGYVVSLSGGSDSSACAVLVAHMVASALNELGEETFASCLPAVKKPGDSGGWIKELLTLVYQRTDNSSTATADAAESLAAELGAEFHLIEIQAIIDKFENFAAEALGKKLSWEKHDLPLQNIQARVRAPFPWLLANAKGALLIATSNRSEVALGYATMDGDTSGGLAPLGGIDKPFLLSWLAWAQKQETWGVGPVNSLEKVLAIRPTAELRPPGAHHSQSDEVDLMPYDILTRIEQYFVWERMEPPKILELLKKEFDSFEIPDLKVFLIRFLKLWARNQWKRERYAPSFHIDKGSLDPKTWCRFPIFSGGFSDEIAELGELTN